MEEQPQNDLFGSETAITEPSELPLPLESHPAREPIMEQFGRWLDETLASEAPPQGFEAEVLADLIMAEDQAAETAEGGGAGSAGAVETSDLYALWAAVTAVAQQMGRQSESLKKLNVKITAQPLSLKAKDIAQEIVAGVTPAFSFVEAMEKAAQAMILTQQETLDQTRRMVEQFQEDRLRQDEELRGRMEMEVRRESLDLLIDIRDRMKRGYKTARAFQSDAEQTMPKSWTNRLLVGESEQARTSGAVAAALVKGYRLTLDRISEAFQELGLEELECLYQKYDDSVMKVIDYEVSPDVEDGVVVEVYQTAYLWHGQVYRKAHVKVARQSS